MCRKLLWALAVSALVGAGLTLLSPAAAAATLDPPTLLSPDDFDAGSTNPVLTWSSVSGATKYHVQISTDSTFASVADQADTVNTSWVSAKDLPSGQLFWRVYSYGAAAGPYSQYLTYTKTWNQAVPTLESPDDGTALHYPTPVVFSWDPLPGAASYTLQYESGTDPGFASATTVPNITTTSYAMPAPQPKNTYSWRVAAVNAATPAQTGGYSDARSYSYDWPTAPTLITPTDGASMTDVLLSWSPVPGAKNYRLQVSDVQDNWNDPTVEVTVPGTSWTPTSSPVASGTAPTLLPNKTYYWRVQALDAVGNNTDEWSDQGTFTRSWTPAASTAPIPISPAWAYTDPTILTAVNGLPRFAWTAIDHAAYYELWVSTDPTFSTATKKCFVAHTSYTPYKPQPSGVGLSSGEGALAPESCDLATVPSTYFAVGTTYYWQVRGIDATKSAADKIVGVWSQAPNGAPYRFTVAARSYSATAADVLAPGDYVTPAKDNTVSDTPELTWNPATVCPGGYLPDTPCSTSEVAADFYRVTIANDSDFTNPIADFDTSATSLTPRASLLDSQAGHALYWFVQPCTGTPAAPSTCGPRFDNDAANNNASFFHKISNGVSPMLPSNSDTTTVDAADLVFRWQDFLSSNQDATVASDQEAKQYDIEIASDVNFTNVVDTAIVDGTEYYPPTKTYKDIPLFWKVAAIDASGHTLAFGPTWEVVKKSATIAPAGQVPAADAQASGVPTLAWSALPGIATYNVGLFASPGGGAQCGLTGSNLATSGGGVKYPAYTAYTKSLAAGWYAWEVQSVDATGNTGAWSPARCFRLLLPPPTLTMPNPGLLSNGRGVTFRWEPVLGAVRYKWHYGSSSITTSATSWIPTTALPSGQNSWFVESLGSTGNVLSTSAIRSSTVDTTAPTVKTKLPSSIIAVNGAFSFTFSEAVSGVNTSNVRLYDTTTTATGTSVAGTVTATSTGGSFRPSALLVPGRAYTLRLLGGIQDAVHNPLTPVSWKVTVDKKVENNSPAMVELWDQDTLSGPSGGALHASNSAGAYADIPFTGSSVSLLGKRAPDGGYARVQVDGGTATQVSYYAGVTGYQQTIFAKTGLTATRHTLRLTVLGTKPTASKGTWVYLDALKVGSALVQESSAHEVHRRVALSTASGGSYDLATHATAGDTGARPSFRTTVYGATVTVRGIKSAGGGKAYVYVDNVLRATVDTYATSTSATTLYSGRFAAGNHAVRVDAAGTSTGSRSGLGVDYISVT